jgi:hypothetical protein
MNETALQKEMEILKKKVRSLQGASNTLVNTDVWREFEDKFDREALIEL